MECPKCRSNHCVKDGIVRGKQRYQCKDCRYHYTVERKSDVKTNEIQRLALEMYLEGLGVRIIGRILKISYGTVYAWVKEWSSNVSFPRRENPMDIVDLEEMLTYIQSRNTTAPHYGLILIDLDNHISLLSVK